MKRDIVLYKDKRITKVSLNKIDQLNGVFLLVIEFDQKNNETYDVILYGDGNVWYDEESLKEIKSLYFLIRSTNIDSKKEETLSLELNVEDIEEYDNWTGYTYFRKFDHNRIILIMMPWELLKTMRSISVDEIDIF